LAHNKLYRNFIILQEDERGYSHSNDKALSGYAKVEAKGDKCKISFYAQNLRQEDNYSMVLICCKRDLKQLIDIGPLAINEVGKGDTSKEYYVNNIAGLGISYEKISGAAICRVKDSETEFIMHGFMNGEESADNWRKFKIVKVDSKKYINKVSSESKEKDTFGTNIANKAEISQPSNPETNLVKKSKLQSDLVERKKDEISLQPKANIESKVEDKQDRIPEDHPNIVETIDNLDEDRNKDKEYNKCEKNGKHDYCEKEDKHDKCDKHDYCEKEDKHDKCDKHDYCEKEDKHDKCDKHDYCGKENKHDKCDKHDYFEKEENIEEVIGKLVKKLDTYDGVIDLKVSHHIYEDVIVYGFIKDKKNVNGKWKKFKLEKKCRNDNQDFNNIQSSSRRIEENFKLDKINSSDKLDRLDTIDFDAYENKIQPANLNNTTGQTGTGTTTETTQVSTGTGVGVAMGQTGSGTGMGQVSSGTMWQPWSGNEMSQAETGTMGETGTSTGTAQASTGAGAAMGETGSGTGMGQVSSGAMWQPWSGNEMSQTGTGTMGETGTSTGTTQEGTGTGATMGQTGLGTGTAQASTGTGAAMGQTGLGTGMGQVSTGTGTTMGQTGSNQNLNMSGDVGQYFEKLAQDFQPFVGRLNDINFCKWYKIIVNSIDDLSDESNYNKYTLAFYPMLNYYPYISKSGHFLLGYKCNRNGEMQYIVYAIPGSKEKSDQPYGGRTGFVTWTSDNKDNQGYWLMFYDFKNSSIVIPAR
jgi:hypothetical protein